MLCGLLIRNYLAVNDQLEATQSSAAVKEFHEEVFCDVVNKKLQISAVFFKMLFDVVSAFSNIY